MSEAPSNLQEFMKPVEYFLEELDELFAGRLPLWKCDPRDFSIAEYNGTKKSDKLPHDLMIGSRCLRVLNDRWTFQGLVLCVFRSNLSGRQPNVHSPWFQDQAYVRLPSVPVPGMDAKLSAHFAINYPSEFGGRWKFVPRNDGKPCFQFVQQACQEHFKP